MLIHLGSDLHLEFGRGTLKVPGGDVLLLAGDIFLPHMRSPVRNRGLMDTPSGSSQGHNHNIKVIKRQEKFLSECSMKYQKVFMIVGNHEHYHGEFYKTHDAVQAILDRLGCNNIKLMDTETVEFGDYVMFGSTFWTDLKGNDPLMKLVVEGEMNDYYLVRDEYGNKLRADATVAENTYARGQLVNFFAGIPEGKKPIVMTHMAPFFMSVPDRYKLDEGSFGYANTKIEYLIDPYQVPPTFWIHGHTHDRFTYSFGNIQVICNPRGYMGAEPMSKSFEFMELPDKVLVETTQNS